MANCQGTLRPYSYFVDSALRARQFAESQTDTPDLQRKRKQQREQQERSDLLELADEDGSGGSELPGLPERSIPAAGTIAVGSSLIASTSGVANETVAGVAWARSAQASPTCRESVRGRAALGRGSNPHPRQQAEWWKGKAQSVTKTGCVHAADGQLHVPILWEALLRCRCRDDEHCIS